MDQLEVEIIRNITPNKYDMWKTKEKSRNLKHNFESWNAINLSHFMVKKYLRRI